MNETVFDLTNRAYVIAEIGSCHEGQASLGIKLVEAARRAGCDAVKAQWWSSAERMAARRNAPELQLQYARSFLPWEAFLDIAIATREADMLFGCTVYLPEDAWRIAEHVDFLKVSSFECQDKELLVMCTGPVNAGRALIVSLGMGASDARVRYWLHDGVHPAARSRIYRLACTSAYPAPIDDLGIDRVLNSYCGFGPTKSFRLIGYSDHSPSCETSTGAFAVCASARIVERHLRLDQTPEDNPEFGHAMTPDGMAQYVEYVRKAQRAMGVGRGWAGLMPCEQPMLKYRVGVLPENEPEAACR